MNNYMTPEARELYNEYMREYRRKNPEKVKKYKANTWNNKVKKIKEELERKTKGA